MRCAQWLHVADHLFSGYHAAITTRAWTLTFDAVVALHRGRFRTASNRLAIDPDDPETWWDPAQTMYRTWYAAVWAEAAVLDQRPDAQARIQRARQAARANPIAWAMVERAEALAAGDRRTVDNLAAIFEALRCPQPSRRHVGTWTRKLSAQSDTSVGRHAAPGLRAIRRSAASEASGC